MLVAWRTSRNRAAIWKSLVLPASGATLGWVLLSTLWMAPLDHARSYEFQMQQLAQNMQQNHASACMLTYGLGRAQIAAVRYYTNTDTALLRAYDRKTDIDSDGLHYKFELRIFVEKPEDAVKMQTLSIDQKVDK